MKSNMLRFFYKRILKPVLFLRDPEKVHDTFTTIGRFLGKYSITRGLLRVLFAYKHKSLVQTIQGVRFPNPVGLSAGFDKDANLQDVLPEVGFGFEQIGSVTLHPYAGNPGKRLHRLKKSKGLVVYYGLKNIGVERIIQKLKKRKNKGFTLGISVAKTNSDSTAAEEAGIDDYFGCLKKLIDADIGNFYTINISCPNTFGGEPFTTPEKLDRLLSKLRAIRMQKPMFVKMPMNLPWNEFDALLKMCKKHSVEGVIISNLTKDRDSELIEEIDPEIKGGISGKPTEKLANELISKTYEQYKDDFTIVGVGGIFSAEDAYEKIKHGASLVQLITGMIFEGPQLIGDINRGLVRLLKADGYDSISEAIGAYHRS